MGLGWHGFDLGGQGGGGCGLEEGAARESVHDGRASLAQTKIGWRVEVIAERYDPFGGVHRVQWVLHHLGMDRTREFWLRLAVIEVRCS